MSETESITTTESEVQLIIVTGMSGAGRSETMHALEDIGFYCVDNLPPRFILNLIELISLDSRNIKQVAAACDIRSKEFFPELMSVVHTLKKKKIPYKIIFLDASDDVLIKRFKKNRRKHPLSETGKILDGVTRERELLRNVKEIADYIIDTSNFELYQLKERIKSVVVGSEKPTILITVSSFDFKYGIPLDSDVVFDVRFLPNPYYVEELKSLSGLDEPVKNYVLKNKDARVFIEKVADILDFLIPHYEKEGKTHLAISIGCTGGRHRSVVIAETVAEKLKQKNQNVTVNHRDINKEA